MSSKKVLMIVGDFVEDYECMVPRQCLEMVGHAVTVVSPGKSAGDVVQTAVHDFEGYQTFTEKLGHRFPVSAAFEAVSADAFDALMVPGGRSPEFLREDPAVIALVQAFFAAGKPVACLCHGGQLLTAADVLRGRRVTFYPAIRSEVSAVGGLWQACDWTDAVVDGNLVTAPAWTAHPAWLAAFLRVLGTRIEP